MKNATPLRAVLLAAAALLAACSATRASRQPIEESGFLCDYSLLEDTDTEIPGDVGPRPRLRWIDPDAEFSAYEQALVDPVVYFCSKDVRPSREIQVLLDYFCVEVREELRKSGFELVDRPQPRALRVTVALTRVGERQVTLDTLSTYIPIGRALAELEALRTGKPTFVGHAKVEVKITDAATGDLVSAAMDKRVGGKTLKDFDSWSDVRSAVDYWAQLLAYRICILRGIGDCRPPRKLASAEPDAAGTLAQAGSAGASAAP